MPGGSFTGRGFFGGEKYHQKWGVAFLGEDTKNMSVICYYMYTITSIACQKEWGQMTGVYTEMTQHQTIVLPGET